MIEKDGTISSFVDDDGMIDFYLKSLGQAATALLFEMTAIPLPKRKRK